KLIDSPQHRALVLLGYEDAPTAADQVPQIMEHQPIALETFDQKLVDNELAKGFQQHSELLPRGEAWLLVEFGADSEEEADELAESFVSSMRSSNGPHVDIRYYEDEREIEHVWNGCMHTRIDWDFSTVEGIENYRRFMEDAGDLIASYGGSLSGEHGDGQARAELLPKMFGEELVHAFSEFKAIWDPDGKMNPGKVVAPFPLDTNLRMDAGYRPFEPSTHFSFHEDEGSFVQASQRCFGVGVCRDQEDTMCPSYMATGEERHSTRGRARLLFELLRGEELEGGWHNEE